MKNSIRKLVVDEVHEKNGWRDMVFDMNIPLSISNTFQR
jgi:hypothetical protein